MLQYFIWYLILLPFYLPSSSLIRKPALGITAAALWVFGQVCPLLIALPFEHVADLSIGTLAFSGV